MCRGKLKLDLQFGVVSKDVTEVTTFINTIVKSSESVSIYKKAISISKVATVITGGITKKTVKGIFIFDLLEYKS